MTLPEEAQLARTLIGVPDVNDGTDRVPSLALPAATVILIEPAPLKLSRVTALVFPVPLTDKTLALAVPVLTRDISEADKVIPVAAL